MAKAKSGGGIKSKNVVRQGVRTGKPREGVHPGYAGQLGTRLGSHTTERREEAPYRGESFGGLPAIKSDLGNTLATNVKGGGPGKGRTVFECGSQQGLSPVKAPAKPNNAGKDILLDFGPDHMSKGRFSRE